MTTTVPLPNQPDTDTGDIATLEDAPFVVRWGLFDAFLGVPVVLAGTLLVGLALAFTLPFAAANAFTALAMQLMMAGWVVSVARRKGNGPFSDFGISLVGLTDFISSVVLGFSLLMIGSVAAGLVLWMFGLSPEEQASNVGIVNDDSGSVWKWVMIASVVIGAPIAEELFFRGLLLGALRRRFGSIVAVVGSSLAFTSVHYGGGTLAESTMLFVVVGTIGLVLGAYVIRTGRVLPTIIAHSVFNALVVTANF